MQARLVAKIKKLVFDNRDLIYQEVCQTKEVYQLLLKWQREGSLSKPELDRIKIQLIDICKAIPAIAIFLVPFGTIVLIMVVKYLPFEILPSAFYGKKVRNLDSLMQ